MVSILQMRKLGNKQVKLLLFSCSVVSDSLQPNGLQHTRLSCPAPSPGACSNSCPLRPSIHLILYHPLLLLPSSFSSITVFSNESALRIRWPKYWSFSISPSNEYAGLISFRIDWFDLLAVPNTTVQKHQFLWHSAFFIVQLLHPYMTTGKTIALTMPNLCWQSNVSAF